MSDKSGIEWTDATWNVVTGCTQIPGVKGRPSGCDNCYAKTLLDTRQAKNPKSERFGLPFERVLCHEKRLSIPRAWRRPRRIFVNSLADLFHIDVPDQFIRYVFAVMALTPRHTFQILTKRPERAKRFLTTETLDTIAASLPAPPPWYGMSGYEARVKLTGRPEAAAKMYHDTRPAWPLRNVQLGTSISTNDDAWRADTLRETPASIRYLSVEPMLGSVDAVDLARIDWVICGGESGPAARPMHPGWARDLRDRCAAAKIPFFFKQWGEWSNNHHRGYQHRHEVWLPPYGAHCGSFMSRVGKAAAGRVLDGRTWDEFPQPRGVAV